MTPSQKKIIQDVQEFCKNNNIHILKEGETFKLPTNKCNVKQYEYDPLGKILEYQTVSTQLEIQNDLINYDIIAVEINSSDILKFTQISQDKTTKEYCCIPITLTTNPYLNLEHNVFQIPIDETIYHKNIILRIVAYDVYFHLIYAQVLRTNMIYNGYYTTQILEFVPRAFSPKEWECRNLLLGTRNDKPYIEIYGENKLDRYAYSTSDEK